MAATNSSSGANGGRTLYYRISYGALSANMKDAEGLEEISITDLKSKRSNFEKIDLRGKYIDTKNGKDYPLRVFFEQVEGTIVSLEKDVYDQGVTLKLTVSDLEGDICVLQTDFYGKVSSNLLNRLAGVNPEGVYTFKPYSIPSEFENESGVKVKYYASGVSVKNADDVKQMPVFKKEDGLPQPERILDAKGQEVTSRVKQINFLFDKVKDKFNQGEVTTPTAKLPQLTESAESRVDDLPF